MNGFILRMAVDGRYIWIAAEPLKQGCLAAIVVFSRGLRIFAGMDWFWGKSSRDQQNNQFSRQLLYAYNSYL